MQILELLFLIDGLKNVIFALFTHIFDISKTVKILQIFSQFSRKFLQIFLGNRFTCMHFPGTIYFSAHFISKFEKRHTFKIDAKRRHSNSVCSTLKQSSAQYITAYRRKMRKTDGRRPRQTSPYHNTSRLKTDV